MKASTFSILFLYGESESFSCSVVSDSLRPHGLLSPWNSPDHNTGVDCHSLSPGDLPDPGIEARSPTLQAGSLPLSHKGSYWLPNPFIDKYDADCKRING